MKNMIDEIKEFKKQANNNKSRINHMKEKVTLARNRSTLIDDKTFCTNSLDKYTNDGNKLIEFQLKFDRAEMTLVEKPIDILQTKEQPTGKSIEVNGKKYAIIAQFQGSELQTNSRSNISITKAFKKDRVRSQQSLEDHSRNINLSQF